MPDPARPANPRQPNPAPATPDESRQPPAPEQPAEEWGERQATGREIASGGKAPERPPGKTPTQPE